MVIFFTVCTRVSLKKKKRKGKLESLNSGDEGGYFRRLIVWNTNLHRKTARRAAYFLLPSARFGCWPTFILYMYIFCSYIYANLFSLIWLLSFLFTFFFSLYISSRMCINHNFENYMNYSTTNYMFNDMNKTCQVPLKLWKVLKCFTELDNSCFTLKGIKYIHKNNINDLVIILFTSIIRLGVDKSCIIIFYLSVLKF